MRWWQPGGAATVGPPAPTCSGPEGLVGLEISRLDSAFFRGLGACELSLSNDVHLFTGYDLPVGSSKPLVHSRERGANKRWRGKHRTKKKMRDEHETLDVNKVHSSCQWTSSKEGGTRRDKQIGWEDWWFVFLIQLLLWIYKKKKKQHTEAEEKYVENRKNNNSNKVQCCVISMNMNRFERSNGFSRTFKLNRLNTPGQKGKYTIISSSLTLLQAAVKPPH